MTVVSKEIYRSPNGDRWFLANDTEPGKLIVRHEANAASGGHVTETDLAAFLSLREAGPQHFALREMLERGGLGRVSTD